MTSGDRPGLVAFGLASGPVAQKQPENLPMDLILENPSLADAVPAPTVIKAISLWQPWASLIARGVKLHETRSWPTEYRGWLAIHAAKTLDLPGAPNRLCASALGFDWWSTQPLGCIVAVAEIVACKPADKVAGRITRADLAAGDFGWGRFAWELAHVRPLRDPIPLTGRQGLFNWTPPTDLEALLGPERDHHDECRKIGWS